MSAFNCRSTNYFGASNFDVRSKSGAKTPRTPKHFMRNAQKAPLRFAQLSECDRVVASLLLLQVIRGVSIDIVRIDPTLGWVTAWLIVHAWNACVPEGTGGSNPPSVSPVERQCEVKSITDRHNKCAEIRPCPLTCRDARFRFAVFTCLCVDPAVQHGAG
jgi:hypothetical protein